VTEKPTVTAIKDFPEEIYGCHDSFSTSRSLCQSGEMGMWGFIKCFPWGLLAKYKERHGIPGAQAPHTHPTGDEF
jgi:hypothetical protein